jgi:hypothetical protein
MALTKTPAIKDVIYTSAKYSKVGVIAGRFQSAIPQETETDAETQEVFVIKTAKVNLVVGTKVLTFEEAECFSSFAKAEEFALTSAQTLIIKRRAALEAAEALIGNPDALYIVPSPEAEPVAA